MYLEYSVAPHTTTSRSQPTDLFPRVARPPQRSPPQAGYFRTLRGTQSRKPHFLQSSHPSLPKTRIPAPLPSWAPSPSPLCTSAPSRAPRLCNEGWGGGRRPKKHGRLPGMDKIKNKKKSQEKGETRRVCKLGLLVHRSVAPRNSSENTRKKAKLPGLVTTREPKAREGG
ncbi:hypothetical protein BGZ61DRAFT_456815 [Ilyonectria robusta]|uniref:uncharacterized protein n=1 Tax=Ilyonectria robusta TaxID=1079257 RepID=UPI001E8DE97D|nr:uncharacterized protein BGZ61DRAFT_456815 [Ilyonectria robusta]KAH8679159.1 hypothetical protein BGZ61DRAFT_456815 [Ilyonectria robusta]